MREKLYLWFFYQPIVKRIGGYFLKSPWFVNNFAYQYFQKRYINKIITRYIKAPNVVVIENTNMCNSHCSMCPHGVMVRKQGVMKMDLYQKIINECVSLGITKVNLHNFGEPLVDKEFVNRVEYAKKKGISYISTSTNGALLNKKLAKEIILSGIDAVNFSLDAYSQEAYEKIRVGLPYKRVMDNVAEFIDIRNNMNRKRPLVVVDFIKTNLNKGEEQLFIKRWKNLADKVNITTLHSWAGSFKDKVGKQEFHLTKSIMSREPCRFLFTDMVINWDGRVSACCQDYEVGMAIGDLNKNTIKEIWRGKILNNLRDIHLANKMSAIPLCQQCDYRSIWWLFK